MAYSPARTSVTGPSSVTEAMAHGRKAAVSIDIYLKGVGAYNNTPLLMKEESLEPVMDYHVSDEELERLKEIFPIREESRNALYRRFTKACQF